MRQKSDLNVAELAVEMDKYFIDCKPNNLRWETDESLLDEGMFVFFNLFLLKIFRTTFMASSADNSF